MKGATKAAPLQSGEFSAGSEAVLSTGSEAMPLSRMDFSNLYCLVRPYAGELICATVPVAGVVDIRLARVCILSALAGAS